MVETLFNGQFPHAEVSVRSIIEMLRLVEYLKVPSRDADRIEFYRNLAKVTTNNESFRSEVMKHKDNIPGIKIYMLQLLREYARTYGVNVMVTGYRATLCTLHDRMRWPNESGSASKIEAVDEVNILNDAMLCIRASEDKNALPVLRCSMCAMDIYRLDVAKCKLGIGSTSRFGPIV